MKLLRKALCVVLVCCFLFSPLVRAESNNRLNLANVQAELGIDISQYAVIKSNNNSLITPFVVTACPYGNGICEAVSRGTAYVFVNGTHKFTGACWQCSRCKVVYGTQYDPFIHNNLGYWCAAGWSTSIPKTGAVMYVSAVSYTSSRTIPGVAFRNAQ